MIFLKPNYCCVIAAVTVSFFITAVRGTVTVDVVMPSSYCDGSTIKVDAAHVYGIPDELRSICTITLKADLDKFIIGFSHVKLSCGQYLKLYYGPSSDGEADKVLDCTTEQSEINFFMSTPKRYLTIRHEKPLGMQRYNFSLIVTSYEQEDFCKSDQLPCMFNWRGICIDDDLRCDGIKNCPDAEDERMCSKPRCFGSCRFADETRNAAVGDDDISIPMGILIPIVVLCLLGVVGFSVAVVCCCRQQHRHRQGMVIRQQQTTTQQSVQSDTPATVPLMYYSTGAQPPPQSSSGQPLPTASPGGYQPVPVTTPVGYQPGPGVPPGGHPPPTGVISTADAIPPPPAPYNPQYGPGQAQSPPGAYYPGLYSTKPVASAPPLDV